MKFYINGTSAKSIIPEMNHVKREMGNIEESIHNIYGSLKNYNVYDNVCDHITKTNHSIEMLINTLAHMEDGLEKAVNYYLQCEQRIINQSESIATKDRTQRQNSETARNNTFIDWWNDLIAEWGFGDSQKAKEVRNDKAMAKELKKLLKNERYSKNAWKKASVDERKEILRELFDDMKKIYGIDVSTINFDSIESEPGYVTYGYLSYFNSGHMEMTINSDLLDNSKYYDLIMDTMAHELRHGYQHSVVDHPEKYEVSEETINTWRENFDDYKTLEEDGYKEYRKQAVEKDARKFAGMVV